MTAETLQETFSNVASVQFPIHTQCSIPLHTLVQEKMDA